MRFTPTPVVNPVLTHGQARVAKDFHPAPGDKPETVQRETIPPGRTQNSKFKTQNSGGNCIAMVPDATLAYMLTQAKCGLPVDKARKAFLKWHATQPPCADWRISFRTFALAHSERHGETATAPPPAPVAQVTREVAEADGMISEMPVPAATPHNPWLARLRNRQAA